MKITQQIIKHPTKKYSIQTYHVTNEDEIIKKARRFAQNSAKNLNDHAPSGRKRSEEEKFRVCFGGHLAELVTAEYLQEIFNRNHISGDIKQNLFEDEMSTDAADIDILIVTKNKTISCEVRSSFPFLIKPWNFDVIFNKQFDILGWYTAKHKPVEQIKDFYFRIIYYMHPKSILEKLDSGKLQVHLAGGASKELLELKGYDTSFKQSGATFRAIKPITEGMDIFEMQEWFINKLI